MMATESRKKTVLVHFGERARPVKFCGGGKEWFTAIKSSFEDVLPSQIRDDEVGYIAIYVPCLS